MDTVLESQAAEMTDTGSNRFHHGAHLDCQREAEFVVLVCGIAAAWSERGQSNGKPFCPVCEELARCPVCGIRLIGWAE